MYRKSSSSSSFLRKPKRALIEKHQDIDYKNLEVLQRCIGSQGQMLSRRRTGLTAKRQRELKQAIKRSRHLGLLPFVG